MAMDNNNSYNLTVTWGKFLMSVDENNVTLDPPELKWCWHAIATIVIPSIVIYNVPLGWAVLNNKSNDILQIEYYAYTWSAMSASIQNLSSFWELQNNQ